MGNCGTNNSGMNSEKGTKANKNMNSDMKNPAQNPSVGGSSVAKKSAGEHKSSNKGGTCGA